MGYRHTSYAPLPLALMVVLVISFANLPLMGYAGSSDLTVDGIWLEDASQPGQPISQVSLGQSFLIVATIKNIGQEAASGYYVDVYYDSDYGRGGPDNILAGEVQTWYVGPLTAQDGTHTTKWVVDPDNQIAELDETNNQKEYIFTVGSQTTTTTTTTTASNSISTSTSETTTTSTTNSTTSSTYSSTTNSTSTSTSTSTQSTSTSTSSPATVSITVTANPSGSIVVDGTTYTSPQTLTLVPGSSHIIAANSPVSGAPGTQYVWTSWADGGAQSRTIIAPSSSTTYTANYQTQYQVTYSQTGCSLPMSPPATEWVNAGGSAVGTFPATVASGDGKTQCLLQSASAAGPIDAPTALAGTYKTQYKLTMQVNPVGSATTNPAVGTYWYDSGQNVSIQASPASGYKLRSWTGSGSGSYTGTRNPAFVIMNGPLNETATLATTTNSPPTISSLTPGKASGGQVVGSAIAWTCLASDTEGDPIVYRFFVRPSGGSWSMARDWSSSNTWSWTPSGAGSFNVACHVRDGNHAGVNGWDDHKEAYGYSVTSVLSTSFWLPSPEVMFGTLVLNPELSGSLDVLCCRSVV